MIVYCKDCSTIEDAAYYDAMIVDPPYSAHVHKNATSQSAGRGTRHRDLGFVSLTDELRYTLAKYTGMVKRWSLIYSDIEGLGEWRETADQAGATYIRAMPWIRWSMPQLSGDRPPQGFELVTAYWGAQGGAKSWNGPGNLTHLAHKCLRGEGKHKAEKPLDQMLDLVSWFTNPGEHVLDPCAGSGTVGLACRLLGREYTGFEIDPQWAGFANERLFKEELSERDAERYARWQESQVVEQAGKAARKVINDKARAKNGHQGSGRNTNRRKKAGTGTGDQAPPPGGGDCTQGEAPATGCTAGQAAG